jgi:hypothetical protein
MINLLIAVILGWDPSPTPNVNYRLKYGTKPGIYTVVQDAGTAKQIEVKGLSPGTYYFAGFSYNGTIESSMSNEVQYVQASPSPTPTPTPTPKPSPSSTPSPTASPSPSPSSSIVSVSGNNVTITWTPVPGAVKYSVYWDDNTPTQALIERSTDFTPPHTAILNGTPSGTRIYYFEVRAVNSSSVKNKPSNRVSYPAAGTTPSPTPTPTPIVIRKLTVVTKHRPGEQVVVKAPPTFAGKTFKIWIGDISVLANPMLNETTATIPNLINPVIEATYNE